MTDILTFFHHSYTKHWLVGKCSIRLKSFNLLCCFCCVLCEILLYSEFGHGFLNLSKVRILGERTGNVFGFVSVQRRMHLYHIVLRVLILDTNEHNSLIQLCCMSRLLQKFGLNNSTLFNGLPTGLNVFLCRRMGVGIVSVAVVNVF